MQANNNSGNSGAPDMPAEIAGEATAEAIQTDLRGADDHTRIDTGIDIPVEDSTASVEDIDLPGPTYRIDAAPGASDVGDRESEDET